MYLNYVSRQPNIMEMFEDIKEVIKSCKSNRDRQYSEPKKKDRS